MSLRGSVKRSVKQAKQLRISWTSGLAILGGTLLIGGMLEHFGRFDLATPTVYSAGAIGLAIATKWELKGQLWFWITMTVIAALHVPLILFVPWTTKWVPAIVIAPFLAVDLYAILVILSVIEKFVARKVPGERSREESPSEA